MALFFRVCAYALLAAVVILMVLNVIIIVKGPQSISNLPTVLLAPIGLFAFAGGFAFFALWPAMMWHCLVVNKTTIARKALWFILVLFTLFIGTLIYYFVAIEAEA
jgi:hypothetical protein